MFDIFNGFFRRFLILFLIISFRVLNFTSCKSVRYGAASFRNNANKNQIKESKSEDSDQDEESDFHIGLFVPSYKVFEPSRNFEIFKRTAGTAFLADKKSATTYYFAPTGTEPNAELLEDNEVCDIDMKAEQLVSNDGYFENPSEIVTLYFLCQEYCCQGECCELNLVFLACLTFFITLLLCLLLYGYCRFFARKLHTRRPQELAALKMYKSKFKNYADRVIFSEQQAMQIFSLSKNDPTGSRLASNNLPTLALNGRPVR